MIEFCDLGASVSTGSHTVASLVLNSSLYPASISLVLVYTQFNKSFLQFVFTYVYVVCCYVPRVREPQKDL